MKTKLTNRSFYEIMAVILEASKNGAKPTEVFYSAGLSYEQYRFYVDALCAKGLLVKKNIQNGDEKEDNNNSIFNTTEIGMSYLKLYSQMVCLSGDILVKLDPSSLSNNTQMVT